MVINNRFIDMPYLHRRECTVEGKMSGKELIIGQQWVQAYDEIQANSGLQGGPAVQHPGAAALVAPTPAVAPIMLDSTTTSASAAPTLPEAATPASKEGEVKETEEENEVGGEHVDMEDERIEEGDDMNGTRAASAQGGQLDMDIISLVSDDEREASG